MRSLVAHYVRSHCLCISPSINLLSEDWDRASETALESVPFIRIVSAFMRSLVGLAASVLSSAVEVNLTAHDSVPFIRIISAFMRSLLLRRRSDSASVLPSI